MVITIYYERLYQNDTRNDKEMGNLNFWYY